MGHARDSSADLAALAGAGRPPRARRPADRARCDRGHAAAPALPPGLRHRPAGRPACRALRSLQSRSLSGSCCDHRENPRIPCGTPLPLSYWMRASRTAPRRLLRRTKTGSPAHLPADSSFRPRAALSRQPSLKAMSGMPPGEAAAWWCAYDQSVLRDLDRDVFDDHGPAHFHARHAQGSAKVRIDSLEVIETTLPRCQLRFVLAWAELHQDELRENWRRARAGETLQADRPAPMIGLTPDITEATVIRHGVLGLRFADGLSGQVEVLDRMRGPVFDRARTPEGFAEVTVDPETGTVVWPGGADLAPDTLYERVRTGAWPDQDVAA